MSTVLRGLGPQPRWVYWVRRAVVGLVAVLVLVLVWALFLRGDDGEPSTPAAPSPETSAPTEGEGDEGTDADTSTAASRTCEAADLQLTLTSDAASYPAGATPTFTVTLVNAGATACTVDAGTASLGVLITSGADRIWSSLDCVAPDAEGAERMLLLTPGAQEMSAVPWGRVRSDEACTQGLPEPRPGTYHVQATLLGAQSNDHVFTLE
jgi:hypothetical protein